MNQPPDPNSTPLWQPNQQPGPSGQSDTGSHPGPTAPPKPNSQSSAQVPRQWPPLPVYAEPLRLPASPSPYQQLWRTPWLKLWQPFSAIVLGLVLWFVATVIGYGNAFLDGYVTGNEFFVKLSPDGTGHYVMLMTPGLFLTIKVILALLLPITVLIQLMFFGLKPGWLISVTGKVRKGGAAMSLAIVVPIWIVLALVDSAIHKIPDLSWNDQSQLLIVGILITTPWQAAGEEFMFRGLIFRGIGSYFDTPKGSFWAGAAISSVSFAAMHAGAADWTMLIHVLALVIAGFLIVRAAKWRNMETLTPRT